MIDSAIFWCNTRKTQKMGYLNGYSDFEQPKIALHFWNPSPQITKHMHPKTRLDLPKREIALPIIKVSIASRTYNKKSF